MRRGILSRESSEVTKAEAVPYAEGNMCGAVMPGVDTPSRSKTPSPMKGVVAKNLLTKDVIQVGTSDDHYVLALPMDLVQSVLNNGPDGIKINAGLSSIDQLQTHWMNGILFYLSREVDAPKGHVLCVGSPRSMTSIQPLQCWPAVSQSPAKGGS